MKMRAAAPARKAAHDKRVILFDRLGLRVTPRL
jgi:hypothetical protein